MADGAAGCVVGAAGGGSTVRVGRKWHLLWDETKEEGPALMVVFPFSTSDRRVDQSKLCLFAAAAQPGVAAVAKHNLSEPLRLS
jgi:hypothetical protein